MSIVVFLFWLSLGLLVFCYAGYAVLMIVFNLIAALFRKRKSTPVKEWLPVTVIVAAYNEKDILAQKIRNTLELDYPREKLQVIVVTDGSTDGSEAIVQQFTAVQLLHESDRKGKIAAVKRAMKQVQTPVVIFSDANTMLNKEAVKKMMAHYSDAKVGGVAGEKRIIRDGASALGEAEGLYWQYESLLKKSDAGFYTVVGAAGELFSIRTPLFVPLADNIILDDFVLSMLVSMQGYKIAYEPGAFATELPSASLAEEMKRKIRIAAGAYQAIGFLKGGLNFFKYPALSFQYISRRLLRWVVCPPMLLILLLSNCIIVASSHADDFYPWFLFLQLSFYLLALPGWWLIRSGKKAGLLAVPFYFVFMNYCLVRGFIRFARGRQTVLWEKSMRQTTA